MSVPKQQSAVQKFLSSTKSYPVLAGLLAGLYPLLFYATNNFTLVNTWGHFVYFTIAFLAIPVLALTISHFASIKVARGSLTKYIIPFLGTFGFLFLMHISYYGSLKKKISLGLLILAFLFAFFLWKQYKKVMLLQGILGLIGFVTFIPKIFQAVTYDDSWKQVAASLEDISFKKTPNVYFIQPDGYVNFSELSKGYYGQKENELKNYLQENNFTLYPDIRSNYASTLTSNSATFMGKHHYYEKGMSLETYNARNTIITENWALSVFKRNNYKSHFITELPYLLLNRPTMGYDYCNISYDQVSYIGTGLGDPVRTYEPLKEAILEKTAQPKFFFVELFNPGHIHGKAPSSEGREGKKKLWFESLAMANEKVMTHIDLIKELDPDALVVIMADHGGFVGFEYIDQVFTKTQDRDLLYSVFSINLAVLWPEDDIYEGKSAGSAINIFKMLFSYLSNDQKIMETTADNSSYLVIKEGTTPGVYKVLDDSGKVTFEKQ